MRTRKSSSLEGPACVPPTSGSADHPKTDDLGNDAKQVPDLTGRGFPGIAMSLLGILAAGAILKAGSSFLIPLTVAFFLMLLLQPVSRWTAGWLDTVLCRLNRRKGRDHRSRVLKLSDYVSVILVILVFLLLAGLLYLMVSGQIVLLASKSGEIEESITRTIESWMTITGVINEPPQGATSLDALVDSISADTSGTAAALSANTASNTAFVRSYVRDLKESAMGLLPGAAVPIISMVFTFIMILFITAFLLIGRRTLEERLRNVRDIKRIEYLIEKIESSTRGFLQAKILCSLLTGLGVYILLDIFYLSFQDALIWGLVYLVLNFIPFYGSIVAGVGTTLYTMSVHDPGNLLSGWPVIVMLVVLDLLMSNGLEPKLMQRRLPIGPVTVLFVVILWAWLWGAWGMILALPLSIMFRLLLVEIKGEDYWLCILMEA